MPGEDLLRETLAEHAERAPRADRLVAAARERAARRRRGQWAVAAAAVGVAGVAVAAVAVAPRPESRPAPLAASASPAPATAAPGEKMVSFRGLQVAVPAGWTANDRRCQAAQHDTYLLPNGIMNLCLAPEVPGLTVLSFGHAGGEDTSDLEGEPFDLDGHAAYRKEGTARDGRHLVGVEVPDLANAVWVVSPDLARARALVARAHVVDVDWAGCPARVASAFATPPARPGADAALVPPGAVDVSLCWYGEDLRQVGSARSVAGPVAAVLAGLPPGYTRNPPDETGSCTPKPDGRQSPYLLRFHYPSGPDVDVWVNFLGCRELGANNGAVHGGLTHALVDLLARTVGAGNLGWTHLLDESP